MHLSPAAPTVAVTPSKRVVALPTPSNNQIIWHRHFAGTFPTPPTIPVQFSHSISGIQSDLTQFCVIYSIGFPPSLKWGGSTRDIWRHFYCFFPLRLCQHKTDSFPIGKKDPGISFLGFFCWSQSDVSTIYSSFCLLILWIRLPGTPWASRRDETRHSVGLGTPRGLGSAVAVPPVEAG